LSDRHGAGSGARLRLARQARGYSQQQMADMAGVTRQAIMPSFHMPDEAPRRGLVEAHCLDLHGAASEDARF
jgi:transcriptional regulator with XRE-family HTH domain